MPKCSGITASGAACGRNVAKEGDYCAAHKDQALRQKMSQLQIKSQKAQSSGQKAQAQGRNSQKCELKRYTPSDTEIDNCIYTVTEKHKGAFLGKGEQGAAYVFENLVIKVTELKTATDENVWLDEACKGQELGALGIAPKIYRYFVCGKNGFIVMDRLTTIRTRKTKSEAQTTELMKRGQSDVVRYKEVDAEGNTIDVIDDIRNLTREQQWGFVTALEIMIDNGYLHMDNHIDNLGFIAGRPIAFDFGFTQKRRIIDRRWALCFSVFQILEHCPVAILEETEFYRVATACINDTYIWGRPESGTAIPLSELVTIEKEMPFLTRITKEALKGGEVSPDLKVGSLAYARIIGQEVRYGMALDLIYLIRNPAHTEDVSKAVIALAKGLKI
jgi:hypothetical protein